MLSRAFCPEQRYVGMQLHARSSSTHAHGDARGMASNETITPSVALVILSFDLQKLVPLYQLQYGTSGVAKPRPLRAVADGGAGYRCMCRDGSSCRCSTTIRDTCPQITVPTTILPASATLRYDRCPPPPPHTHTHTHTHTRCYCALTPASRSDSPVCLAGPSLKPNFRSKNIGCLIDTLPW